MYRTSRAREFQQLARRIFFSFHYQNDIFRVNVVRNSDITKKDIDQSGYWDHSLWEETKKKGDQALMQLINSALSGTSVSVVLAGSATANRKWVVYEIVKGFEKGNGLITVFIHNIPGIDQRTSAAGSDPLALLSYAISSDGKTAAIQSWANAKWNPYLTISADALSPAAKAKKSGTLASLATKYDWVTNDGYKNFRTWVENAASAAGR
jgi:MTH538 TIR-like domain (DUF1863)